MHAIGMLNFFLSLLSVMYTIDSFSTTEKDVIFFSTFVIDARNVISR